MKKSLTIDPNNENFLDTKGFILINLGRYEKELIECFDRTLGINPDFTEARDHKRLTLDKLKRKRNGLNN